MLQSVAEGELSAERFGEDYQKLNKESQHYEMTYLEKQKRGQAFGKMLKIYQKSRQKQ